MPYGRGRRATNTVPMKAAAEGPAPSAKDSEESDLG